MGSRKKLTAAIERHNIGSTNGIDAHTQSKQPKTPSTTIDKTARQLTPLLLKVKISLFQEICHKILSVLSTSFLVCATGKCFIMAWPSLAGIHRLLPT